MVGWLGFVCVGGLGAISSALAIMNHQRMVSGTKDK
jgi:hypothetical protein